MCCVRVCVCVPAIEDKEYVLCVRCVYQMRSSKQSVICVLFVCTIRVSGGGGDLFTHKHHLNSPEDIDLPLFTISVLHLFLHLDPRPLTLMHSLHQSLYTDIYPHRTMSPFIPHSDLTLTSFKPHTPHLTFTPTTPSDNRGADHGGRRGKYDEQSTESEEDGTDLILDEEVLSPVCLCVVSVLWSSNYPLARCVVVGIVEDIYSHYTFHLFLLLPKK